MNTMNEIMTLWQEHQAASFPNGVAGDEIEGEDLVSLDSFTAGCISTFVDRSGSLDPDRTECLLRCREGIEKVLPKLTGEARTYYSRLNRISELALKAAGK